MAQVWLCDLCGKLLEQRHSVHKVYMSYGGLGGNLRTTPALEVCLTCMNKTKEAFPGASSSEG